MIRGFKNSEYLKYSIDKKMDEQFGSTRKVTNFSLTTILSSILASGVSGAISSLLCEVLKISNPWGKFFACLGIILVCIAVTYIIFYFIIKMILFFVRELRYERINKDDAKKLIERFDNIACDGTILVRTYLKNLSSDAADDAEKKYLIYECIHYLKKSIAATEAVVAMKGACITTQNDNVKIDLFRVCNLIEIMKTQVQQLKENDLIDSEISTILVGMLSRVEFLGKGIDSLKAELVN